jgi:hypothetical protein
MCTWNNSAVTDQPVGPIQPTERQCVQPLEISLPPCMANGISKQQVDRAAHTAAGVFDSTAMSAKSMWVATLASYRKR